ncbi:MAG: class II fructose-bisphosphatase [Candidatus Rokubacteria bacterium]|nr:class II fructose-bisphosphatase [Candidatus Rokubacteria bacterium]
MDERHAGGLDPSLGLALVRVTESAALAAARWIGRGQKAAGDGAAVDAMRRALAHVAIDGVVVIGEGEKDEAPMLFNGEIVGSGRGPAVDIAVDPIEGTSLLAQSRPDAIAVIAVAPRGTMWSPGPAFYMSKLVVGAEAREAIEPGSLTLPVAKTLAAIAEAKRTAVEALTVYVLDKPRHAALITEILAAGARVVSRTEGDVMGALLAATPRSGVDVLMGTGGTPEGVIAATAVRALGGTMLVRLAPQKPGEREAVLASGVDLDRVLTERDLVRSADVLFAATGVTDGVLMRGVRYTASGAITDSILIRGTTGTRRRLEAEHRSEKLKRVTETD